MDDECWMGTMTIRQHSTRQWANCNWSACKEEATSQRPSRQELRLLNNMATHSAKVIHIHKYMMYWLLIACMYLLEMWDMRYALPTEIVESILSASTEWIETATWARISIKPVNRWKNPIKKCSKLLKRRWLPRLKMTTFNLSGYTKTIWYYNFMHKVFENFGSRVRMV